MCCDDNMFEKKFRLSKSFVISLPNAETVVIEFVGNVHVMNGLVLENVLFVPSFHCNLLSVGKLVRDQKCNVLFTPTRCLMQAPSMKRPLLIGRVERDLFLLDDAVCGQN